ncbi:MAG: hypothetical protein PUE68_01765 [Kiritimatiellae bacterium]|nr:hypothetical protein [Kiritimatiellia bacterium]
MRRAVLVLCALAGLCAAAARLRPVYMDVTLPPNIAPLNMRVLDAPAGETATCVYRAADGDVLAAEGDFIRFEPKAWRTYLARHAGEALEVTLSLGGRPALVATNHVSRHPVDACLTYRLIPPGYTGFHRIGVYQRDLATFDEWPLYRNDQGPAEQCMNCHTYRGADPETWMLHLRKASEGTVVHSPKYGLRKVDLATPGLPGICTYPAWHPSGDFLAFSVNEARQEFYWSDPGKVEVFDLSSDLVLYSLADDAVSPVETGADRFECYPAWSPDGRTLFTTARRTGLSALPPDVQSRERLHGGANITNIYYDLCMRTFDPATRTFSAPRTLLDGASAKLSVSLPRVSPDGRWLVFAAGHCGQFHIWHRDADLWIVDLTTLRARPCTEINSSDAESYHCFSSDGRWMVFSSRRDDGAYTRPYLAAFDPATGTFGHPFLLPVEDPAEHGRRMLSYNVPEFSSGRVRMSPRRLRQAASGRIRPTKWTGNAIIAP